ncbi:uncharacterized protein TRAVEDRAFT_52286 [Trametes versicolor FP-101664 SS1]|uniref:uncharacterized protein n=1 Tax=Trametes versicolor (strain FP-101664) TaxID=717944 RepID=UPI0004622262|nr:uncharacterized protein TRAVEDRAFT_52286 [Trametes versicolor FP-101664 SS1]EIW54590.1 hypothetical protein TRAVEDRAFT_52286 [Trametes versicolor FP-101664 SS1]
MSNPSSPTSNQTEMVLDPAAQNAPQQQGAAMQPDSAGSQQQLPVPYQVPNQYAGAGPSHAPLHPMAQGGFPHAYASPYGAPLPYQHQSPPTVSSAALHPTVQYAHAPASSSMPGPDRSNAALFLPPGMPPLMPIPGMSWAAVPNHHLLVAHSAGCSCCTEFVRHYQAAMNDSSFRNTLTAVQTQLQSQFWGYFEEHARSREGESRAEHARQVEDLERQLQAAVAEATSLRKRARINAELEQELNAARAETTTLRQDRNRYRSERNQAREMLNDENCLRARASQSRPNQARPEASGSLSRHAAAGSGPTVDFQDFEELSSGDDEEDLFDEKYIKKKAARKVRQNAVYGTPLAPPPRPPSYSSDGRFPRPWITGWPYHMLAVPEDSNPREADHWYDFVPVTTEDAQQLLRAAATDLGQARCHAPNWFGAWAYRNSPGYASNRSTLTRQT